MSQNKKHTFQIIILNMYLLIGLCTKQIKLKSVNFESDTLEIISVN